MKDIRAIKAKGYLLDMIAQGEHEQQDFKFSISDARKIARSISAFANNSGGRLLIGVKDNGHIAGIRNEEDIYVIEQAAEMYCSPPQKVEFSAFSAGEAGVVICASIAKASERPVRVKEGPKQFQTYYRVADENIAAHPLMVKAWRLQASGNSLAIGMQGATANILEALRNNGPMTIEHVIRSIPASERTIKDAIVRLAAIGFVQFIHSDSGFMLTI